mgnify:CR=1 FL=1
MRKSIIAAAIAALCLMPDAAHAQIAGRIIINQLSGKCLDVPGISNMTPGTPLQLYDCEFRGLEIGGKRSDQFWIFGPQGNIRNALAGYCIDITGTHNGALLQIQPCNGANPAQIWIFRPDGFVVNQVTGKCIDVAGSPGVNSETPLLLSDCEFGNPQTDQRWRY